MLQINNAQVAEEYFEDASLVGIQCSLDTQKLVWQINQHCAYDFRYQTENEVEFLRMGRKFKYPIYLCQEQRFDVKHILYNNQQQGEYLLPELKHIDFIWMVKSNQPVNSLLTNLITELKRMDKIQLAMQLDNRKIINKQHLVL